MLGGSFEQFHVPSRVCHSTRSRRSSTGLPETVKIISSALARVQKPEREVHRCAAGSSVLTKRKCLGIGGRYLVRDGVCLSLRQEFEGTERAGAAVPLERCLLQC